MKTRFPLLLVLACALHTVGHAAAPSPLTVAVFDFEAKGDRVRDLGPKIATLVSANLSADPNIVLVERAELKKVLSEDELGLSGNVSPDSAARIGQLTGAKVLVTGRVFTVDKETVIVAKIIGVETGRVYGEISQGEGSVSIVDLSSSLATKIAAVVTEKGETLTAHVATDDERIAKLQAAVQGKKLPVVAVAIAEKHYGRPAIDPAAETELGLILQRCGFTVADAASTQRPTLEISGEAFSAFALRNGNLVSCNARMEIKVRDLATGNILDIDRQTGVAVDTAEQTSGKKALEAAALGLAERLVPKLAPQ